MHRTPLSLLRIWTLLLLAACGDKEATRVDEGAVAATERSSIVGRTAFPEDFGTYPRLIRLTAHPTAAGALIATFESKGAGGAAIWQLWLYSGNGGGGFFAQRIANATNWNSLDALVGTADVSGDGLPDVWARELATGALWLSRGTARAASRHSAWWARASRCMMPSWHPVT